MPMPFPGMDPYLEHPVPWEGVHRRLIVAIGNQLQPRLDPRYITSIEERVYIEGPQRRIPDLWIQRVGNEAGALAVAERDPDSALILDVEELEVREPRIEILDAYNGMKLVALVELVSPTNKVAGFGRKSYRAKQREVLQRDCHLVEIDLLRRGKHVLAIPKWRLASLPPFEYLVSVSRWPLRSRFEVYPRQHRERLPSIKIPLAEHDPDIILDLQLAFEQVYEEGRFARRVRYDEPCVPPLSEADQTWASERWTAYKAALANVAPTRNRPSPPEQKE